MFETLPTVFFCESNLQPVSDCERHYRAGYGSIQFSHNQAEVDLGTMPLYSQIPRNTTSLLRAMKNRSYWKIPENTRIAVNQTVAKPKRGYRKDTPFRNIEAFYLFVVQNDCVWNYSDQRFSYSSFQSADFHNCR